MIDFWIFLAYVIGMAIWLRLLVFLISLATFSGWTAWALEPISVLFLLPCAGPLPSLVSA